jgi:hypothetical protein
MQAPDRTPERHPQPAQPRRISLAGKVLVILLSFFVTAAVCEVLLRIYLINHTVYDIEMVRYATLIKIEAANPLIGHEHKPNVSATLMDVPVRTNSDGLRDVEHDAAHGDRHRIIFPTEIINFGTGNYNTEQEVNLFLEKGLKYHPDKVVVFYFINDAEPTPKKARFAFLYESRLVTLAWSRLHALESNLGDRHSNYRTYYADLYQPDAPGWQRTQAALVRLRDVCAERGIELQVVVLPELHELQRYPFENEHAAVVSYLRSIGVSVLDLTPRFKDETNPIRLWVAPDDAHPNALAHELIAKYALDFLAERNP